MNAGWILCLALVSQTPTSADGWQSGGTSAVAQTQFAAPYGAQQPGGNQFTTVNQFAPQQQAGQQQAVDPYGRPIVTSQQTAAAQGQVQPGQQHPRQNSGAQLAASQGQQNNLGQTGNQQFAGGQVATTPAWQLNSQSAAGQQQYAAQQNAAQQNAATQYDPRLQTGVNQQSTTSWQQASGNQQVSPPLLVPPQNAPQQQSNWLTQQQQQQRDDQLRAQQQYNQDLRYQAQPQWATSNGTQQQAGDQQFANGQQNNGSQFTGNQSQFGVQQPAGGNQYSNTLRNPQVDLSVGSGGSQFGAQVNLGDNGVRVADNSQRSTGATTPIYTNATGQTTNQFGQQDAAQNYQPTLSLQPPLSSTLPAGSNQQAGINPPNVNPHVLVQPPRADDPTAQTNVVAGDSRWNDWRNSKAAGDANSQQPAAQPAGAQPNPTQPAGQPTEMPSLFANAGTTNTNQNPSGFGQSAAARTSSGDPLFASASLGSGRTGQNNTSATGEKPESVSSMPLMFSLLGNFFLIGSVLYLGWIAFESHFRYRRLLVEGDDYDDSRRRDDDRDSRRRS